MTASDRDEGEGVGALRTGGHEPSMLSALSARHGLPAPQEGWLEVADGTRLRHASWQAAEPGRLGTVVHLQGRTEFIEKIMDVYAILYRSGFDVWAMDWRGQGLSTRALADPDKGHVADYQHFLDDLHRFLSDVVDLESRSGRKLLLAHSMGGHIGLRYLHDHPGMFEAAAFSAPMIDIGVNKAPVRWLNAAIVGLGGGSCYALRTKPFSFVYDRPGDPSDNGTIDDYRARLDDFRLFTHDAGRFMEIQRLIRSDRRLALGGPTAAWLQATCRSINLTWSPGYAEAIETPVLIVGGGRDRVVVTARQEAMARRLPKGRFHMIDQAAHELLVECDDVRAAFFEQAAASFGVEIALPPVDMSGCAR